LVQLKSPTDRARLAEEKAAVRREASLRRIATLVAGGVTAGELFSAVAREVSLVLDAPVVTVDRYELEGGSPVSVVLASREDPMFPVGSRWPLDGPGARAWIYETRRAVRIEDFSGLESTLATAARQQGMSWVVGAPIIVDGAVWGNICAGTTGDEPIPDDAESRLADFTDLVSTAIANSDAREKVRRLAEEQAALRRVATLVAGAPASEDFLSTVAREVASVLNVPGVIVQRYERDGTVVTFGEAFDSDLAGAERIFGVGTRMPRDPGSLAAQVFDTHRPARIDDFSKLPGTIGDLARAAGLGSGCAGPVVVNGELWGKMCIFSRTGTVLPGGTEDRLSDFIELVATAIANYEARADLAASEARARELAEEQAALRRVATLVAQGASPDELFSAVAKEVAGIIDIPVVGVHRYDPDGTVTTLGIAGETSLTVGTRLRVTDAGMAAMILSTGRPSRIDDYASVPRDAVREDMRLPMVGVPIVVEGSIWGFMVAVAAKPGRLIPAGTEERLARFTELVATAVSNATTRTELLTSRARLVSAADETRRRLERDLHDGIQQWLVALALRARKAAGLAAASESAARDLSGLADDLVAVTDELREISRGIHPAILSDAGLDDALEALARRSTIRVDLDVSFQGRYDPTLEATVYYVAAESITNAVKHAQSSTVMVRGGRRDGSIELEIRDDGVGGADPGRGTGLIGLKDRVDTLGGTISFASPAGAGTTIRVKLPAGPRDGEDPPLPGPDEAASPPASG
jgi:signal transduction histidine kinase